MHLQVSIVLGTFTSSRVFCTFLKEVIRYFLDRLMTVNLSLEVLQYLDKISFIIGHVNLYVFILMSYFVDYIAMCCTCTLGIGSGKGSLEQCVELASRPTVAKQWKSCKHLIVDEISMVDGDYFDKLETIAR